MREVPKRASCPRSGTISTFQPLRNRLRGRKAVPFDLLSPAFRVVCGPAFRGRLKEGVRGPLRTTHAAAAAADVSRNPGSPRGAGDAIRRTARDLRLVSSARAPRRLRAAPFAVGARTSPPLLGECSSLFGGEQCRALFARCCCAGAVSLDNADSCAVEAGRTLVPLR